MPPLHYVTTKTPDGLFSIIIDNRGRAIASGFGSIIALLTRLPKQFYSATVTPIAHHPYQQTVLNYYDGDTSAFEKIPRHVFGTPFQQNVWHAMETIPYGSVTSYHDIATQIGSPRAVRAVGSACKANRLPLIIPCHRIVKSDSTVGNYLYGTDVKLSLLRREGVLL